MIARLTVPVLLTVILGSIGGCSTTQPIPATPVTEETYAALAESWNARVQRLARIHREGVAQITRVIDGVSKSDQADLSLWIELPQRTALRAHKSVLGVEFIWLGSDDKTWWLFDLSDADRTVEYLANHGTRVGDATFIEPLMMLEVLGLMALPPLESLAAPPTSEDDGYWRLELPSQAQEETTLAIRIDPRQAIPVQVVAELAGGDRYTALLEKYDRIRLPGLPPLDQPLFPRDVRIDDGTGSVKLHLSFDDPAKPLDTQPWENLFDRRRLERRYKPKLVEVLTPVPTSG